MSDERASVLLVDDRPENLLALQAILAELGQRLVTATSGEEALAQLLREDFAVILLDVQMPKLDGFETAALIKQREKTKHIPIIFLTAISKGSEHVFRGYEAGAVDYVFKPFDPALLRAKVSVFIELHRKNRQLEEQAEQLRERELDELRRQSEEQYRFLAESIPQQVWTAVPTGELDYVNDRVVDYLGRTYEQMIGSGWTEHVRPDDLPAFVARWTQSLESGEPFEFEFRLRRQADEAYRWHLGRALAMRGGDGAIVKWFGTNTDIDDQKRAEAAQRFLVEASAALGSSLDYERMLATVAELAVPEIADWCAVDVVEPDGSLRQITIAHADPAKVTFARELRERYQPDPQAATGVPKVIRTGEPELVTEIADEVIEQAAVDDLHLDLLRELGLRSWICVPLVARGRTLGAISLVSAESGRLYGPADLALAENLAGRAAAAVDNARLYAQAEERARAARVLATIGDGVFMLDRDGVIRLWNRAAEAIIGLAAEKVLGRPATDVIPGWRDVAALVPVSAGPGPAETVPLDHGGRELWLSISGVGFDEGTVYAFRDLTEEHVVEEMKSDFVATVSHELRTPLAAIYGAAVTIRRPDLDLEEALRGQLLEVIADESSRLAQIVEDVLLVSHLNSGQLQLAIGSCNAAELARSVVDAAETHRPENISISLAANGDLPPVAADANQLQQVLGNLVDNAVKYSPDGGPVEVSLARSGSSMRFSVRDEGLGIPVGEQRRIFEKFYRLDPDMTRGIGGTGLGLYICRELVRRMDGRIWVESQEDQGSTFSFEIPLADGAGRGEKQARGAGTAAG